MDLKRAIHITERFHAKHRYYSSQIQKAIGAGRGWISVDEATMKRWEADGKQTCKLDCLNSLFKVLHLDSRFECRSSARGTYKSRNHVR